MSVKGRTMKRLTISLAKSPWKGLLLTGSILAILTACGDDSSKPHGVETPVREVSTIFELGPCNADRQGDTILVLDKASEYLCSNSDWVEIATPFENGSSGNVEGSQTFSSSSSFVDNKTADSLVIKDASIMGAAHKGPFKFNSPIMLHEAALRNDSLVLTGRNYIDEVSSNKGDFVIPKVSLVSPYAVLEVRGLWKNEVSGGWSKDSMTLYALTDLSGRTEVNINLLTHLEIDRAQSLINKGYSVYAAKKQAEFEIMTAFGFATTVENAEDLKTFVSSGDAAHDANATLMAISLLFIGERNDAEIQNAINNFKRDLAEDGVWDDTQTKANMADWAEGFDGGSIRANVKSWNILDIPNYENFLTVFWNNAYELGGCASTRLGVVAQNKNEKSRNYNVHYICKITGWQKATDYEKDTYQWTNGKDGDVRKGNVTPTYYTFENGNWIVAKNENVLGLCDSKRTRELAKVDTTYFVCRNEKWNHATALEYDTYEFGVGKEGEVRVGKVNTHQYYVYENGAWRTATSTIEKDLGACVTSRESEIGKSSDTYYICKSRSWTTATALEYDTYGWTAGTEGEVRAGNVSVGWYYVYEDGSWRASAGGLENNLGGCVTSREGELGKAYETYYICKSKVWTEISEQEYDTYGWSAGTEGEVKQGDVNTSNYYVYENGRWRASTGTIENDLGACVRGRYGEVGLSDGTYYTCKENVWQNSTTLEYDTYGWNDGTEGEVRAGNVNSFAYYVYENGVWRPSANAIENSLGACVENREGEVDELKGVYYTCKANEWQNSTVVEYDTYGWDDGTNGEIRAGNISGSYYVFKQGKWVVAELENALGVCSIECEGVVEKYQGTYYICKNKSWQKASILEYDTYGWGGGTEGEVRNGVINTQAYYVYENGVWRASKNSIENNLGACVVSREGEINLIGTTYYICKSRNWQNATVIEYNTYGWEPGIEGEVRKGLVSGFYIYKNDSWQEATILEYETYGWGPGEEGEVRKGQIQSSRYFIYKNNMWQTASILEYNTYGALCPHDGEIVSGIVTSLYKYVCDADSFRMANTLEIRLNKGCVSYISGIDYVPEGQMSHYKCDNGGTWLFDVEKNLNTFIDSRDGTTYKMITIGNQTWMAENLNYNASETSYCNNCATYGRLYTWNAAVDKAEKECGYGHKCSLQKKQIQGICPDGWHLPDSTEFAILFVTVGGQSKAAKVLKSATTDWYGGGRGTDLYGFSALPTGVKPVGSSGYVGRHMTAFWTSKEADSTLARCITFNYKDDNADMDFYVKNAGVPIRCVKNEE